MIQTLEPVIREHPFFTGLEERHIQFIVSCASSTRFKAGELILRAGDPADTFYLVREGLVAVEFVIPHRGPVTVATVGKGEVLGWSWLIAPNRWRFNARALQPTRALGFDGRCFRNKCETDHDLGYEIMKRFAQIVSERLEATRVQLLDIYGSNA